MVPNIAWENNTVRNMLVLKWVLHPDKSETLLKNVETRNGKCQEMLACSCLAMFCGNNPGIADICRVTCEIKGCNASNALAPIQVSTSNFNCGRKRWKSCENCFVHKWKLYSLVPIRRHGSINRQIILLFDPVLFPIYEAWLLFGSILNFEALLGAPLIKTT